MLFHDIPSSARSVLERHRVAIHSSFNHAVRSYRRALKRAGSFTASPADYHPTNSPPTTLPTTAVPPTTSTAGTTTANAQRPLPNPAPPTCASLAPEASLPPSVFPQGPPPLNTEAPRAGGGWPTLKIGETAEEAFAGSSGGLKIEVSSPFMTLQEAWQSYLVFAQANFSRSVHRVLNEVLHLCEGYRKSRGVSPGGAPPPSSRDTSTVGDMAGVNSSAATASGGAAVPSSSVPPPPSPQAARTSTIDVRKPPSGSGVTARSGAGESFPSAPPLVPGSSTSNSFKETAKALNQLCHTLQVFYVLNEEYLTLPEPDAIARLVGVAVRSPSCVLRLLGLRIALLCCVSKKFIVALMSDTETLQWIALCGDRPYIPEVNSLLQFMLRLLECVREDRRKQSEETRKPVVTLATTPHPSAQNSPGTPAPINYREGTAAAATTQVSSPPTTLNSAKLPGASTTADVSAATKLTSSGGASTAVGNSPVSRNPVNVPATPVNSNRPNPSPATLANRPGRPPLNPSATAAPLVPTIALPASPNASSLGKRDGTTSPRGGAPPSSVASSTSRPPPGSPRPGPAPSTPAPRSVAGASPLNRVLRGGVGGGAAAAAGGSAAGSPSSRDAFPSLPVGWYYRVSSLLDPVECPAAVGGADGVAGSGHNPPAAIRGTTMGALFAGSPPLGAAGMMNRYGMQGGMGGHGGDGGGNDPNYYLFGSFSGGAAPMKALAIHRRNVRRQRQLALQVALSALLLFPAETTAVSLHYTLLKSCTVQGWFTKRQISAVIYTLTEMFDAPHTRQYLRLSDISVLFEPFLETSNTTETSGTRTNAGAAAAAAAGNGGGGGGGGDPKPPPPAPPPGGPGPASGGTSSASDLSALNWAKDALVVLLTSPLGLIWAFSETSSLRSLADVLFLPNYNLDRKLIIISLLSAVICRLAPHRGATLLGTWEPLKGRWVHTPDCPTEAAGSFSLERFIGASREHPASLSFGHSRGETNPFSARDHSHSPGGCRSTAEGGNSTRYEGLQDEDEEKEDDDWSDSDASEEEDSSEGAEEWKADEEQRLETWTEEGSAANSVSDHGDEEEAGQRHTDGGATTSGGRHRHASASVTISEPQPCSGDLGEGGVDALHPKPPPHPFPQTQAPKRASGMGSGSRATGASYSPRRLRGGLFTTTPASGRAGKTKKKRVPEKIITVSHSRMALYTPNNKAPGYNAMDQLLGNFLMAIEVHGIPLALMALMAQPNELVVLESCYTLLHDIFILSDTVLARGKVRHFHARLNVVIGKSTNSGEYFLNEINTRTFQGKRDTAVSSWWEQGRPNSVHHGRYSSTHHTLAKVQGHSHRDIAMSPTLCFSGVGGATHGPAGQGVAHPSASQTFPSRHHVIGGLVGSLSVSPGTSVTMMLNADGGVSTTTTVGTLSLSPALDVAMLGQSSPLAIQASIGSTPSPRATGVFVDGPPGEHGGARTQDEKHLIQRIIEHPRDYTAWDLDGLIFFLQRMLLFTDQQKESSEFQLMLRVLMQYFTPAPVHQVGSSETPRAPRGGKAGHGGLNSFFNLNGSIFGSKEQKPSVPSKSGAPAENEGDSGRRRGFARAPLPTDRFPNIAVSYCEHSDCTTPPPPRLPGGGQPLPQPMKGCTPGSGGRTGGKFFGRPATPSTFRASASISESHTRGSKVIYGEKDPSAMSSPARHGPLNSPTTSPGGGRGMPYGSARAGGGGPPTPEPGSSTTSLSFFSTRLLGRGHSAGGDPNVAEPRHEATCFTELDPTSVPSPLCNLGPQLLSFVLQLPTSDGVILLKETGFLDKLHLLLKDLTEEKFDIFPKPLWCTPIADTMLAMLGQLTMHGNGLVILRSSGMLQTLLDYIERVRLNVQEFAEDLRSQRLHRIAFRQQRLQQQQERQRSLCAEGVSPRRGRPQRVRPQRCGGASHSREGSSGCQKAGKRNPSSSSPIRTSPAPPSAAEPMSKAGLPSLLLLDPISMETPPTVVQVHVAQRLLRALYHGSVPNFGVCQEIRDVFRIALRVLSRDLRLCAIQQLRDVVWGGMFASMQWNIETLVLALRDEDTEVLSTAFLLLVMVCDYSDESLDYLISLTPVVLMESAVLLQYSDKLRRSRLLYRIASRSSGYRFLQCYGWVKAELDCWETERGLDTGYYGKLIGKHQATFVRDPIHAIRLLPSAPHKQTMTHQLHYFASNRHGGRRRPQKAQESGISGGKQPFRGAGYITFREGLPNVICHSEQSPGARVSGEKDDLLLRKPLRTTVEHREDGNWVFDRAVTNDAYNDREEKMHDHGFADDFIEFDDMEDGEEEVEEPPPPLVLMDEVSKNMYFPVHFMAVLAETREGCTLLEHSGFWKRAVNCVMRQPLPPLVVFNESDEDSSDSDDGELFRFSSPLTTTNNSGVGGTTHSAFSVTNTNTNSSSNPPVSNEQALAEQAEETQRRIQHRAAAFANASSSNSVFNLIGSADDLDVIHPSQFLLRGGVQPLDATNGLFSGGGAMMGVTNTFLGGDISAAMMAAAAGGGGGGGMLGSHFNNSGMTSHGYGNHLLPFLTTNAATANAALVAHRMAGAGLPPSVLSGPCGTAGVGSGVLSMGPGGAVVGGSAGGGGISNFGVGGMISSTESIRREKAYQRCLRHLRRGQLSWNRHSTALLSISRGNKPPGQHFSFDCIGSAEELKEAILCLCAVGSTGEGFHLLCGAVGNNSSSAGAPTSAAGVGVPFQSAYSNTTHSSASANMTGVGDLLKRIISLSCFCSTFSIRSTALLGCCMLARCPSGARALQDAGYEVRCHPAAYVSITGAPYGVSYAYNKKAFYAYTSRRPVQNSVANYATCGGPVGGLAPGPAARRPGPAAAAAAAAMAASGTGGAGAPPSLASLHSEAVQMGRIPVRLLELLSSLPCSVSRENAKAGLQHILERKPYYFLQSAVRLYCLGLSMRYRMRMAERTFLAQLLDVAHRCTTDQMRRAGQPAGRRRASRSPGLKSTNSTVNNNSIIRSGPNTGGFDIEGGRREGDGRTITPPAKVEDAPSPLTTPFPFSVDPAQPPPPNPIPHPFTDALQIRPESSVPVVPEIVSGGDLSLLTPKTFTTTATLVSFCPVTSQKTPLPKTDSIEETPQVGTSHASKSSVVVTCRGSGASSITSLVQGGDTAVMSLMMPEDFTPVTTDSSHAPEQQHQPATSFATPAGDHPIVPVVCGATNLQ